jgi:signal peptidase
VGSRFPRPAGRDQRIVVVQSGSMMHSDDRSHIGVIDTGDLVFVKSLGEGDGVTPYVMGEKEDYRTYGSFGDVIIFKPNGREDRTAIIHRAVVHVVFNSSGYDPETKAGGSFDVPSMGLHGVTEQFIIRGYEWPTGSPDIAVNVGTILANFRKVEGAPHGGYITKGDDNSAVDQSVSFGGGDDSFLLPVKSEWIIGKSRGELPWFGIIKLKLEGKADPPKNSEKSLVFAIIGLVLTPFLVDLGIHLLIRKKDEKEEPPEEPKDKRAQRRPPKAYSSKDRKRS